VVHIAPPGFDGVERVGQTMVRAGAGVPVGRLLAYCREEGLGGLEFLAGLPGTLGGAIAGNAGAWGREVCEALSAVWIVSASGAETALSGRELSHSYRCAGLGGGIVTRAQLELKPRSPELIGRLTDERLGRRAQRHPLGAPSAGCVFKNPTGVSAGRLLDLCGLKGARVGGAEVSRVHANFILNRGGAVASDVLELVRMMRAAVARQFGIELELEVRHWAARSEAA
jgi:UDP-N-acetylmuramate dehydrogenase